MFLAGTVCCCGIRFADFAYDFEFLELVHVTPCRDTEDQHGTLPELAEARTHASLCRSSHLYGLRHWSLAQQLRLAPALFGRTRVLIPPAFRRRETRWPRARQVVAVFHGMEDQSAKRTQKT